MQTLKNKAFRVSVRWDALVRKPLALERGGFTAYHNPPIFIRLKNAEANKPLQKRF